MPELFPARLVHVQHASGAVLPGWALFLNADTEHVEVRSVGPCGETVVSYVPLADIVPAAQRHDLLAWAAAPVRKRLDEAS
jgi:hypothetical protein